MPTTQSSAGEISTKKSLGVLGLLFVIVLAFQVANRSYESEFGRHYDEAAHFVTGLMVHDFLVELDWSSPLEYAENYYLHYPKVALGHWPPVFYLVQAIWFLVFSPTRWSVLLLLAVLAALLGWIVWRVSTWRFDWRIGLVFSVLLLSLPLSQSLYSVCMAEVLLAILVLLAALTWGKYLDEPSWKWSGAFSLLAVLSILTKANGLALALLPLISFLISRRWSLLKKASCWLPALAVTLVCGPWYALTLPMLSNGPLARGPKIWYTLAAVPRFLDRLLESSGFAIMGLAFVAMIVVVGKAYAQPAEVKGIWIALTSLVISVLLFHWIVPASFETRHLFIALPPTLLLSLAALDLVARSVARPFSEPVARLAILTLLTTLVTVGLVFEIPHRSWHGYGAVGEFLTDHADLDESVVLVVSDSLGEGALISEVALRETRPGHVVLRGSKSLSRSSWDGSNYQLLFTGPEELGSWLTMIPVGVIAIDHSVPRTRRPPETDLMVAALDTYHDRWEKVGEFDMTREGRLHPTAVSLFVQKDHQSLPRSTITLDLEEMLGRHITGQGIDNIR